MTTSVKVSAHCSGDKQVRIARQDLNSTTPAVETVIQNGETNEQVVYDGYSITVKEELKSE